MSVNRTKLVEEFTNLRNSLMKRPPTSNRRAWNIYCDHLIDTDLRADSLTDEELVEDIAKLTKRIGTND